MFVHSVFFWLKPELSPEERARFREGVESLQQISCAEAVYIGAPAATDRPVIDRTYDIGLTVLVKGLAEHDLYQQDPIHLEFVKGFSSFWARVQIYDAE